MYTHMLHHVHDLMQRRFANHKLYNNTGVYKAVLNKNPCHMNVVKHFQEEKELLWVLKGVLKGVSEFLKSGAWC